MACVVAFKSEKQSSSFRRTVKFREGSEPPVRPLLVAAVFLLLALCATPAHAAERPFVLILVDGLSWEEVSQNPRLESAFQNGAVANLSTAQGATPEDPLTGYVFLGTGSRADTAVLPQDPAEIPDALGTERALLGETLRDAGVQTATVGGRAAPVLGGEDAADLDTALEDGEGFVAVEAGSMEEARELVQRAQRAGASFAIASPNAARGESDLTPFVISGERGTLYSPSTRTAGLITNADVAPTLLERRGIEAPPEMQGRAAEVRAGSVGEARRLYERISFVEEKRGEVGIMVGAGTVALSLAALLWRRRGIYAAGVLVASLPTASLLAAIPPLTSALAVAALTLILAALMSGGSLLLRIPLIGVCMTSAGVIAADTLAGGHFMKFATLGYNPAYGSRFYGVGNEYSAVLSGALVMGLGALAAGRRGLWWTLPAAGAVGVLVLGLPFAGADVGGSLALGLGAGATAGLLRGGVRSAIPWAAAGLAFAAAVFLASGLAPEASHGTRAASGELDLLSIAADKLLLSARLLLNPIFDALLLVELVGIYSALRRVRGTLFGAAIVGAVITALATGALNDSGIVAAVLALIFPTLAALGVLPRSSLKAESPDPTG